MSTVSKVLAFTVSSLLIVFVGLAIWNRVAQSASLGPTTKKLLGA